METVFWLALGLIAYTYFGYPVAVWALGRLLNGRQPVMEQGYTPSVTLVIAAYNEVEVIEAKLENSIKLDYPGDKLQVLVVSDGSMDGTDDIVNRFIEKHTGNGPSLRLLRVEDRAGKANALNAGVADIESEIAVLSDANVMYAPDAITRMAAYFADDNVGCVTGDVRLLSSEQEEFGAGESAYYKYERFIQLGESDTGGVVGVDGAMYALRRSKFVPIPIETIVDDFVLSMTIACDGKAIVYDPAILAFEDSAPDGKIEFRRKVRVVEGGIRSLITGVAVPNPLRTPLFAWKYWSHKVFRWLGPVFLLAALIANLFLLSQHWIYTVALFGQVGCYAIAALNGLCGGWLSRFRWVQIPYYFALVNAAAFIGLFRGAFLRSHGLWERTLRSAPVEVRSD